MEVTKNSIKEMGYFFDKDVCNSLKHYVYAYYEDENAKKPFYIGKGKDNRCFDHLFEKQNNEKNIKIQDMLKQEKFPYIKILRHGLTEEIAKITEAVLIELFGIEELTNKKSGDHTKIFGQKTINEIISLYSNSKHLDYSELPNDSLIVKIARTFTESMTPQELYEYSRGYWRINPNNKKIDYVLAIHDGIIREVYKVRAWFPAGDTMCFINDEEHEKSIKNRYEFVGTIAEDMQHFKGKRITLPALQNPCTYTNSLKVGKNAEELEKEE